jgi:hypothetical protein
MMRFDLIGKDKHLLKMRIIKYIFVLLLALISKRKLKKTKTMTFYFYFKYKYIYIYILLRPDNEYGSLFFYINFIFIL